MTEHALWLGRTYPGASSLRGVWGGQPQWSWLSIGFGAGTDFLATWAAWRAESQRPRLLHFVAVLREPVSVEVLRGAARDPAQQPLAATLSAQWHGLLPGFHRLVFDDGHVLLTLCIGALLPMLRAQRFEADHILIRELPHDASAVPTHIAKAVARFARRGTKITIAKPVCSDAMRDGLMQCGFHFDPPSAPQNDAIADGWQGHFEPSWTVRRRDPPPQRVVPGHCAVIGAGLAGAAVAASLARRGWRVTVLDAADAPAQGASGLPAGVLTPHVSPDDALLSRLSRAGVRATLQQVETVLGHERGHSWRAQGVIEQRPLAQARLPAAWCADGWNESWFADAQHRTMVGLGKPSGTNSDADALWHRGAGWVRPARLVATWLAQPGIRFENGARVARLERSQRQGGRWELQGDHGTTLAEADRVVIAAGAASAALAPRLPLQAVHGTLLWGRMRDLDDPGALPSIPVNGHGYLIGHVPDPAGAIWLAGATFERDRHDLAALPPDVDEIRRLLAVLHPRAAAGLAPAIARGAFHTWTGVRCSSHDRRPLVGPLDEIECPGVWVSTAMGSRGLTFAALCAELLAARWHGEPLPLPAKLARALDASRL